MATLVKTIKSRSTGDIIYPVTKADAVYFNDNNNLVSVQGKINTIQGLLGSSSISNVGSSITGIIGNEALTTTAQTLAGAINEHQTDISTLNNNLTTQDYGSLLVAGQGITITEKHLFRNGKTIFIVVTCHKTDSTAFTSRINPLFTIPEGYRVPATTNFIASTNSSIGGLTTGYALIFCPYGNGNIIVDFPVSNQKELRIAINYIMN